MEMVGTMVGAMEMVGTMVGAMEMVGTMDIETVDIQEVELINMDQEAL
jgi:hypothetical protein